ncbi:MAG: F0F1 ATP synthase subunit delta [bacterium]
MFSWFLIIIPVITIIIVIVLFKTLFSHHLSSALRKLQNLHQDNIEKEIALNAEIELAKKEREEGVIKGRQEAIQIRQQAKEETDKLREESSTKARQEAERIIELAKEEASRLKMQREKEVKNEVIVLAIELLRRFFSTNNYQQINQVILDEFKDTMTGIDIANKQGVPFKKVYIISAIPISDVQKENIKAIIQSKVNYQLEFEEKVDNNIIAGLIVRLGDLELDGSIQTKLQRIVQNIEYR